MRFVCFESVSACNDRGGFFLQVSPPFLFVTCFSVPDPTLLPEPAWGEEGSLHEDGEIRAVGFPLKAWRLFWEAPHIAAIVGPAFWGRCAGFPPPVRSPWRQGVPRPASKETTPTKGEEKKKKKKLK